MSDRIGVACDAMHAAFTDIAEWQQLGRRWQEESPDYGRDPKCPTDAGMSASDLVRSRLVGAIGLLRIIDSSEATMDKKMPKQIEFSAYTIPIGTKFVLGKRAWKLESREQGSDHMRFEEASDGASTPARIMNPSEVDALYDLGVVFFLPIDRTNSTASFRR